MISITYLIVGELFYFSVCGTRVESTLVSC